jgi:hypothetical protein
VLSANGSFEINGASRWLDEVRRIEKITMQPRAAISFNPPLNAFFFGIAVIF